MEIESPPLQSWTPLCSVKEVGSDCGKRVEVDGLPPLAVFQVEGDFFVTSDTCSHGEASLCEGFLDGAEVECPWHAGKFDVRTGKAIAFPAVAPIKIYRTRVKDGVVGIEPD
ncbi:MAG: non-heme iron oxygenase ferredoxin subunit [Noviherbaspirillum sp.]